MLNCFEEFDKVIFKILVKSERFFECIHRFRIKQWIYSTSYTIELTRKFVLCSTQIVILPNKYNFAQIILVSSSVRKYQIYIMYVILPIITRLPNVFCTYLQCLDRVKSFITSFIYFATKNNDPVVLQD